MVQGFAAQSKGTVRISSRLGQGTTVELWLPRADDDPAIASAPEEARGSASEQQPRGRIIVCDDDGDVRRLIAGILRDLGHLVWEANNPRTALQILNSVNAIDILVVDYAMPDMNGSAVIDAARVCQPGLKAILVTGYPDALFNHKACDIPIVSKPFRAAELSRRVAEVFNESCSER
jgi:CheY-like chemotaxis protein